jgi:hypothetical protein
MGKQILLGVVVTLVTLAIVSRVPPVRAIVMGS